MGALAGALLSGLRDASTPERLGTSAMPNLAASFFRMASRLLSSEGPRAAADSPTPAPDRLGSGGAAGMEAIVAEV